MSLSYFDLAGRHALVTGASSGLGAHFASVLARAGATVSIAARRLERLEALASEIADDDGHAVPVVMDVTDRASVEGAFDALDTVPEILVNNAGIGGRQPFLECSPDDADRVFDTNFRGVWDVGQIAAQRMARAGIEGSIVNIASIMGFGLRAGAATYCVSKAAVVQITRAMASELAANGIRVNGIAPGYFETEMTGGFLASDVGKTMIADIPLKRVGRLEELDGALLLLASKRGSFMTGTTITVDGGHLVAGM